ncbi:DUF2283 domain-containing protein [Kamptonema sp. UHCC 0994]|uniref:DUF2283 domain-containing protein n=1 Tax=Kamptonema sp. UHCC 0994 TaxID=3031329 RepID=UPI0023BAC63F|nr:DUF2283 domain-containing protein [Kamptonema sp. UHCC 0994]MDF0556739.1 DUF2283 domain-containing protein [Kamptonema sp. UHCC 0994]
MKISYDSEVDALYIRLLEGKHQCRSLSPYSPDFNPIKLWWSQLKSLLRQFSPTTTKLVDTIIAVALDLMNPQHLKNSA